MLYSDSYYTNAWANRSSYQELYKKSIENPEQFWATQVNCIYWKTKPTDIYKEKKWLLNGKSNLYYNCVARHAINNPHKTAFISYSDTPSVRETITYQELDILIKQIVSLLKNNGIKKGDVVAIFMPVKIISIATILACAYIGALHMVVFSGFSADVLAWRIKSSGAKLLISLRTMARGGKCIEISKIIDNVKLQLGNNMPTIIYMDEFRKEAINFDNDKTHEIEWLDNQDEAFILYTSGTSGKFKGVVHATLPYMLYLSSTFRTIFAPHPDDIYFCTSDIGWITGHSYLIYAPLFCGLTSVIFDGTPIYPSPDRYWSIIENEKVNIFYTAPTAIRFLKAYGDEHVIKHDLSTLRVLASVGEPIDNSAWHWYFDVIGHKHCPIIDTWWQTETGGIVLAPLRNLNQQPGVAGNPFFGVDTAVVDGQLVIRNEWPGKYKRIIEQSRGNDLYQSGDSAEILNREIKITGRVDDIINVSGHRLCTTDFEKALSSMPEIVESATVAIPHEITGQATVIFVVLVPGEHQGMNNRIQNQIRRTIGSIAKPAKIIYLNSLPKTSTGKIERYKLRRLALES